MFFNSMEAALKLVSKKFLMVIFVLALVFGCSDKKNPTIIDTDVDSVDIDSVLLDNDQIDQDRLSFEDEDSLLSDEDVVNDSPRAVVGDDCPSDNEDKGYFACDGSKIVYCSVISGYKYKLYEDCKDGIDGDLCSVPVDQQTASCE